MSFASGCALLMTSTLRNFAASQLRRLRRPRYLVPAALFLLYLSWVVRMSAGMTAKGMPWETLVERLAEPVAASSLALLFAPAWVLGQPVPRLGFTEAEIQFLFAAPATRRQVVHYALVKAILLSAIPAGVLTLLVISRGPGRAAAVAVGVWVAFSAGTLHGMGASLARAWVHRRASGLGLRAIQAGGLLLLAGAVGRATLAGSIDAGPLSWLLWPARALVRPALAPDPAAFLRALPPAALLLALHYAWVLASAIRFEDPAVEAAERLTRRVEVLRAGGKSALLVAGKSRAIPFRLSASARPETALAWKGLIGISRSLALRIVLAVVPVTVAGAMAAGLLLGGGSLANVGNMAGVYAAVFLFVVLLVGPTVTGGGVAGDLGRLDFLRALPLPGSRIVLGQALAPAILLAVFWTALVPAAAFLLPLRLGGLERACLALALAEVGPPLLLFAVLLQAAPVVAWPGWTAGSGPLAMGRMLLGSLAQLIALPLLSLPAAMAGTVLVGVGHRLVGWPAVPVAAAVTAALLVGEVAIAAGMVGRAFDAVDPSDQ